MGTIRLWTRQDERVLDEINETGSYIVKGKSIQKKYGSCSDVYFHVYDWYVKEASKIVEKPEHVSYPIWLATGTKFRIGPIEGQALLELEVDESEVILFDTAKWDYILNYWYVPESKEEEKHYRANLHARGIHNQTLMYMNEFYPVLKREVQDSWKRLFDNGIKLSEATEATVWKIKKEWIVKVTRI